jgi:hypothetical protein
VNAVNSYGVEVHIVYDGTTTGGTDINKPSDNTHKVLRDGQLLIIREGKTFNVVGAEM